MWFKIDGFGFWRTFSNFTYLEIRGVYIVLSFSSRIAVPPQIGAFEFSDNPINSGDATSIFCTISKGDFPIDLIWTLNGRNIAKYDGITVMRTTKRVSQLNIDSVHAEHAGEYVCTAQNAAGNASHSTSLHVNGSFEIRFSSICARCFVLYPKISFSKHYTNVYL